MRVLVLGGNRYIGLHLVFELARRGHEVTVLNSHPAPLPDGVRRLHGDRRLPGVLTDVLTPYGDDFDVVFDNTAYEVSDLEPLVELFRGRVSQFVFTSSVAVYRRSDIQPVSETFPVYEEARNTMQAYGVGKSRCERYLMSEFDDGGFPATSVRVTHTIGPHSPLGSREPSFFARLEAGRPILLPAEGFPFVHLVHVADVAKLMAALVANPRVVGQVYNAAGVEVSSIAACVRLMAKAVGVEARIVNVPIEIARRLNPPLVHWGEGITGGAIFSIDKARRDIEWQPAFGLEEAYKDSYRWFASEGRDRYEFDFTRDDEVMAQLTVGSRGAGGVDHPRNRSR